MDVENRDMLRIKKWDPSTMKDDRIVMIIGRRGTGKSVLQRDIMRHMSRRLEFGIAMTPTEETVNVYQQHIPDACIYRSFNQQKLEDMIDLQRRTLRAKKTPRHLYLILDDCIYDKKVLKSTAMRDLFLNGRHLHLHMNCAVQYLMDLSPDLRSNIDYVICTRDVIISNRTKLWKYFFGMFSRYEDFSRVFDKCTENFSTIVMDNTVARSTKIEDCVFWYRADPDPPPFRMGNEIFWKMSVQHAKTDKEREQDEKLRDYRNAQSQGKKRVAPLYVQVENEHGKVVPSTDPKHDGPRPMIRM